MKEAIVSKGLRVDIVDSPIPEPADDQVLIQVVVAGLNPKDWKHPQLRGIEGNQGDDMAGIVAKVGPGVFEFRPGDRVAAFHKLSTPHGSYAEYALASQHTTFHLPASTTFEEAATIPLAGLTTAFALYKHLALPPPWAPPAQEPTPLVIYGASTALGTFAIQLARRSNIHPIIGIAGASAALVRSLLDESRGDAVVDYRQGEQAVLDGVRAALAHAGAAAAAGTTAPLVLRHAYDPASYEGGYVTLSKLLEAPDARLAVVALRTPYAELRTRPVPLAYWGVAFAGDAHSPDEPADRELAYVAARYFGRGLQEGWLHGHPHEVVPGGLDGILPALQKLQNGWAHGVKYVVRIGETPGLEDREATSRVR